MFLKIYSRFPHNSPTALSPHSLLSFLILLLPSLLSPLFSHLCVSEDPVSRCLRFFALLRFQHMWYQTDLHGCDKANSPWSLPDRLIWTNSQIAPQIESTLGCGQPSLLKIWISDQQWGQNNGWATTLVTASSWIARQTFRLCPWLHQCGCLNDISVHDVAGMFCYGMAVGWGSVSLPCVECTCRA